MSIYSVSQIKDKEIIELVEESISLYKAFFKITKNTFVPSIYILSDIESYQTMTKQKGPDWAVGITYQEKIYLLHPSCYTYKENQSFSSTAFRVTVAHELCHAFIYHIYPDNHFPAWLQEGLCITITGQIKKLKKISRFSMFIDRYYIKDLQKDEYSEYGKAVEVLLQKFGKEKMLNLLKMTKNCQSYSEFRVIFDKNYNMELSYDNFNGMLNSN